MKKTFLNVLMAATLSAGSFYASAQCTIAPSSNIDGGFFPADSTQPCVVKNQPYAATIQLQNFGTINATTFVVSTRFDTVYNLPAGLSWAMNVPAGNDANTLLQSQIGCIQVTGTTSANAAVVDLDFWVTVDVSLSGNIQRFQNRTSQLVGVLNSTFGTDYDFDYRLFVVDNAVDCENVNSVKELNNVTALSVYPNPFSTYAIVSFNANSSEKYTARLFDLMGKEVLTTSINAETGKNAIELKKENLNKGIYFFTLSNGKATATQKVVIE